MSVSLEVRGSGDSWELILRDYYAQGTNPDYTRICKISREMAETLVENRLAGDLYGSLADG